MARRRGRVGVRIHVARAAWELAGVTLGVGILLFAGWLAVTLVWLLGGR